MGTPRTREVVLRKLRRGLAFEDLDLAVDLPSPEDGDLERAPGRLELTVGDCRGIWFTVQFRRREPGWADDAAVLTGRHADLQEQRSGGLLVVEVDEALFAISFGGGWRWLRRDHCDRRFGLEIAVRCLDPDQLRGLVHRKLATGRVDSTVVPSGTSVAFLRPRQVGDIVRRIRGHALEQLPLTYQPRGERPALLEGADGLRLQLAMDGESLVADLRRLLGIHQRKAPGGDLSFVDDVAPVVDETLLTRLWAAYDEVLEAEDDAGRLVLSVPDRALPFWDEARAFRVRLRGRTQSWDELEIGHLIENLALRDGVRADLERGRVDLLAERGDRRPLLRTPASEWIETEVSLGSRRFSLLEGEWFEFGNRLSREVDETLRSVFGPSGVTLPPWPAGWDEKTYNERAENQANGLTCLDRQLVRDAEVHRRNGVEMCDLLGPHFELIHVKRARGSSAVSHLLEQAMVSLLSWVDHPPTREGFAALARERRRALPAGWRPKRIVFGIQLGRPVTPDSLFPFARVALHQAVKEFRRMQVDVTVVGIQSAAARQPEPLGAA